jgi:ribonuclease E
MAKDCPDKAPRENKAPREPREQREPRKPRGEPRERREPREPREGGDYKKDYEESKTADAETEEVVLGESLDDFLSKRSTVQKKEARKPEGIKGAKIEKVDTNTKAEKLTTVAQSVGGAPVKTGGSQLVGFIGGDDDNDGARGGGRGRGGRGERAPKDKGPRPDKKALKSYSNKDFPSLDA